MNKPTPKIYRTLNWSTYKRELINSGNVAIWFDPKTQWYTQENGKNVEIKLILMQLSNAV